MATSKRKTKYDQFGQPVAEKARGLNKIREDFVSAYEDAKVKTGAAKQERRNLNASNDRPNYQKIVGTSDPVDVTLPDATTSVTLKGRTDNPLYDVDQHGEVTRNAETGRLESQAQRNVATRQTPRKVGPPTLEDALPKSQVVDISGQAGRGYAGEETALSKLTGQGGTGTDPKVTPTIVSSDGTSVTVKQDRINELERIKGAAQAKYRDIINNTKSTAAEVTQAAKDLTVSLRTGEAAGAAGEIIGANTEGLSQGIDRGQASVNASEDAFHASGDIDPNEGLTELGDDGKILPDPRDNGEKAVLGDADRTNTPPARSNDDIDAEIKRLNEASQNKSLSKPQRNAAATKMAELLGLETPKAQKNIAQRMGTTLRNALPAVLGGTSAEAIDPNTIDPATHRPDGSKRQTFIEHLKPNGQPFGKLKLGGGAVAAGLIPEMAAGIALSVEEGTFKEDAAEMIKAFPDAMAGFLKRAVTDPVELAKEIGMDAVDELANLPNTAVAGLGAFNEIVSGRGGRMPASGITGAPSMTAFEAAREQLPDNDVFDRRPDSPQNLRDAKDANAQALIDQSRAESGQGSSSPASTGLRQDAPADPSRGSYFINNGPGGSGFEGVAGGTGGVAQGEKQLFSDLRKEHGAAGGTARAMGLGAATHEIDGRGRFNKDNPVANMLGEFALSRQTANENTTNAFNARTAATLRGSNTTANTAANTANEKRFNDLGERLDSDNPTAQRNARTEAFYGFLNEKEQQGGRYNPNSAYARQAGNILRRQITGMSDPNVPKAIWNSLMPAFLGGGGMGALQWLNGNLNMDGQFNSMTVDPDGTIRARSSDGPVKTLNLGFIPDADTAVFARQVLENTKARK